MLLTSHLARVESLNFPGKTDVDYFDQVSLSIRLYSGRLVCVFSCAKDNAILMLELQCINFRLFQTPYASNP